MISTRLYGLLLRVYPREFRRLYSGDMTATFAEMMAEARGAGAGASVRLWWATLVDVLRSGLRERLSRRGYRVGHRTTLRFPRAGLASSAADVRLDARYAARALARTPWYTAAVVLTLALGIGANSAVFSVVYGVLIRPLPFGEGGSVVHLMQRSSELSGGDEMGFSVLDIEDFLARNTTLTDLSEYHRMSFVLTGRGEPERVRVGVVSHNFFDLLEVRPAIGREFVRAEDEAGAAPVVVLSYEFWQRKFGSDPAVVGETVVMNSKEHTVVGVLPPYPQFPAENELYMPVSQCPTRSNPEFMAARTRRMMHVYGRLASTRTLEDAGDDMRAVASALAEEHPEAYGESGYAAEVSLVHEELVAGARSPLLLLLGVTGLVLLIALANAANLALARSNRRARELSVRFALGAGRKRLARLLLTESVLLSLAGGVAGLALAFAGRDLLVEYAARFTPRTGEIEIDAAVLVFTLITSVATGVLFGVAPSLVDRARGAALQDTKGGTPGQRRQGVQRTLVVVQVSVAFAVLAAAGTTLRGVWSLYQVEAGVDLDQVVAAEIGVDDDVRYTTRGEINAFFDEVLSRLEQSPGVVAAARSMEVPLRDTHGHAQVFTPVVGGRPGVLAEVRTVSPRYLETVGARMIAGRFFDDRDTWDAPFVAVVNESFARAAFGEREPLGRAMQQCWVDGCNAPMTIVGVIADIRQYGPELPAPLEVYRSGRQIQWGGAHVLVRAERDADDVLPYVSQAVHSVEPDAAVSDLRSLATMRHQLLAPRRLTAFLLSVFASVAVGLALAGVFGVLTLAASARTREMGIRKALGASTWSVRAMVVREGLSLVVTGVLVGGCLAFVAGRLASPWIAGDARADALAMLATAVLFLGVAALACDLPARRASRTDVLSTLTAT